MLVYVGIFVLTFTGGVLSDQKPPPCKTEPTCPKDEHYTQNNPRGIRTCANSWVPVSDDCKPYTGCVCDGDLLRLNDDGSGPCVPERKCPCNNVPDGKPGDQIYTAHADALGFAEVSKEYTISDPEAKSIGHFSSKSSSLSKSSSSYTSVISDCGGNKCNDPNAVYKDCPNPCPLTCAQPFPKPCNKACLKKGCECAPGFILNKNNGICIKPKHCPDPILCPKHAQYVINDNQCQKTCGNRLLPNSDTAGACVPFTGCVCKAGYLRKYDNATGPCIPERKCPPIPTECECNEVPTSCRVICPPQTCDSIFTLYDCPQTECEPGCDCRNGYLRNSDGDCIPSEDCFKPDQSSGCNGDANATHVECASSCPATCAEPDNDGEMTDCVLNGCQCNSGYIQSCKGGVCIDPKDCPGGSPTCGANQTYVDCKVSCPSEYCPADDSRAQVACSMPYPCPGGCVCIAGHLIVSRDDPRCVLSSECPEVDCTRPNEVWDPNPPNCFLERCGDRGKVCDYPYPPGPRCVCEKGYSRDENDVCIPDSECPPLGCNGDLNATLVRCPTPCPNTCDDLNANSRPCIEICLPNGCECNPGYVLTELEDGVCIKPEDCPSCKCGPNEKYSNCPSACQPTCDNPNSNQPCTRQCLPSGCVCKPGFIRIKKDGKCIKPEKCPEPGCGGDPNAKYSECPTACEPTCADPDPQICTLQCLPSGCVCKPGFVLNEKDGKCIKPEKCPVDIGCNGDQNATYSECPNACPPTCADRNENPFCPTVCDPSCCECKPGYILTEKGGQCIKPEDCPAPLGCNGDLNATLKRCPTPCPNTCDDPNANSRPCIEICLPDGCECNPGYVLTELEDGVCIKPEDCPSCKCGPNETYSDCPSACQPTCDNPNSNQPCTRQCLPSGCVCKPGYIRIEKDGKCIKPENCPEPGCGGDPNAEYSECPSACEPTCANPNPQICTLQCLPSGCVCKSGFVLNEKDGKCIKPENCPVDIGCNGDQNATYSECPSACPPTCDDRNENAFCPTVCDPSGCECKPGYILTEKGGQCIKPEDCPGCDGDPNAEYSECPSACEPTCANPDPQICTLQCLPSGCVCKSGFVLNEEDGKCIKPENCPVDIGCNGDQNATHSECPSACPPTCADRNENAFCPTVCDPSGCECKPGYILTKKGGQCIKPEDCPEPGCGGDPNAEYSECPGACEPTCANPDPNQLCTMQCLPSGCVCKPGFVLTEKGGKCIMPEYCPELGCNGDRNATFRDCLSACPLTCANQDTHRPCIAMCMPSGCACNPGYVVRDEDGVCILPEDCPADPRCHGDRNATFKECPSACQATCQEPDTDGPCIDMCMPDGCVCKQGYLLTKKGGKCIKPEDCPCGSPKCGKNETYVYCKVGCPTNYCPIDDSLDIIACDPIYPCPGGCACKEGYLILSEEDDRCILSSECPPVECTRPNEVWDPNAPGCLHERCDNKDIPCDFQYPGPPRCVCIEGYYRNEEDICVPECDCPKPGCNGDLNATFSECPSACPATCCEPDTDRPCITACADPGCVCNEGYILSELGGPCISPYDCPDGSPHCCGNMTYVRCKIDCPMKYCPTDENEVTIICDPVWPCPSGCECKSGYLKLNTNDQTCILAADCPPVECSRPNEVWNPSPSTCDFEKCDEMYYTCDDPKPARPKCVCKEGYYRDQDGVCIPAEECHDVLLAVKSLLWRFFLASNFN